MKKAIDLNSLMKKIAVCALFILLVIVSSQCINADENTGSEEQKAEMFVNDVCGDETELAPSISGYSLRDGEELSVAVWSAEGGQDDLRWYQLSKTGDNLYSTTVKPSEYHKTNGEYAFHFYSNYNGVSTFIGKCSYNITAVTCSSVEVVSKDDENYTARIAVSGVSCPSGIKSVSAAIWSRENQSDLVWYNAVLGDDGIYYVDMDIANHNCNVGTYQVHIYATSGNDISNVVGTSTVDFDIQQGTVAAEKNAYGKTYTLTAGGFNVQGTASGYTFAVWSDKNGQDDLTWNAADYDAGSGTMSCTYSIDKLKSSGTVYIDAYVSHSNGNMYCVGRTSCSISGICCDSISIAEQDDGAGTCKLVVSGVSALDGVAGVTVPVWTINNGQDDLKWYAAEKQSNGDYSVTIDAQNHKFETGDYIAHVYAADSSGRSEFIGAQDINIKETEPEITVTKYGSAYILEASNLLSQGEISSATIACWSSEGGQDDLTWTAATYNPYTKTASAVLDSSKLKHSGEVYAHLYVTNKKESHFVKGSSFFTDDVEEADPITVETNNKTGKFKVTIDGSVIKYGTKNVTVPIWSKSDQSDLVWYAAEKNAAGDYEVNANISNHKYNIGTYIIHVYSVDSKMTFVGSAATKFKTEYGSITAAEKDSRYYTAAINGLVIPGGVKSVTFAVWSDKNGQDDLYWYEGKKNGSGNYTADIDLNNHRTSGRYYIHVYAKTYSGKSIFIGPTDDMSDVDYTYSTMTINNVDNENGTFDVKVKINDSRKILGVVVPIWSKSNQSDIKWYNAVKQSDGSYLVTADIRNHGNNSGTYNVHAYVKYSDGTMVLLNTKQQHITTKDALVISNADGSSSRRITFTDQGVSKVTFAVWTVANGQDDLKWYHAKSNGNGTFYADVPASNHSESSNGEYIVHVYADDERVLTSSFWMIDYVEWAIRTANNDAVGYSQSHRQLNPDVDCSSFVFYSVYYNGFASKLGTSSPFSTLTEVSVLKKCGFTATSFVNMESLQPGDILWYRRNGAGHTEIYIGNGLMVGAHDSEINGVDYPEGGDQTGQEVSIKAFSNPNWMMVLRYY